MKLNELKRPQAGAFLTDLQRFTENLSLGDIKNALRRSNGLDQLLVKQLSFASSFRKLSDKIIGNALAITLEIPNVGVLEIEFKLKYGIVIVSSLAVVPKEK